MFNFRSDGPVPPALSIEVSFITDNSNIIKPIPPVILTQAIQHKNTSSTFIDSHDELKLNHPIDRKLKELIKFFVTVHSYYS